ncbi:MAG: DUF433 domain-containing protein [Salinivirgaceae bacterium]
MKYTTISIQGNLISEEILHKVEKAEAQGQSATDFGFEPGSNLRSEIEYAWSRIKLDWKHFSDRLQNLPASDPYGTTLSRKWMEQFLSSLGFELSRQKTSLIGDNNQMYSISHTAENTDQLPIHIVGFTEPNHPDKNTLDIKTSGGTTKFSPHGTMQEYLNVTEHLYGIATNGLYLRLIRDSGLLIKLTYVEFDIKRMLEEDKYSEFTVLYRLIHASRFPHKKEEADQCQLEKYYQDSIETGNRIRDGLSLAVKESLLALGRGFLQHENNTALREKIQKGELSAKDYYRQLLRIIYRFLFLMVTEERDLVYDPDDKSEPIQRLKKLYFQYYSIHRLRKLSENRYVYEAQFTDLWQGLVNTFLLFEAGGKGTKLGIQPLDGDLFSYNAIADLQNSLINNKLLLECVRNLNEFTDENKNLVPINYRSLDVEELGSVYEGLLELHPVIENIEATNPAQTNFTFHEGTDRKTTGSYYTRPDLVNELIKSALIPVIEERLKAHTGNKEEQAKALLKLKVCDAAAGSGHMVLAAGRTIAWYLARVQSGEENPAPSVYRNCLREVIQHCIYAVDMNPDAVELCKLALWLEGHNSGKPLSFLDHKIRCGNSLVGVTDLGVLKNGIPDGAFNAVTGDDKEVCTQLKKENATFNKKKQFTLDFGQSSTDETHAFSVDYHQLEDIKQDTVEAVRKVKTKFEQLRNDRTWYKDWTACNLWTSAFFFPYTPENKQAAPSSERLASFLVNPAAAFGPMVGKCNALAMEHRFFHWALEFPDVFEQGGFDVMLGNPPWEKLQAEEEEFFKNKNDKISSDKDAERRKENIEKLKEIDIELYNNWNNFRNAILRVSKFIIQSSRFPYSAKGNLNLYKVFVELVRSNISKFGRGGLVVQSGLFTDELSKELFEDLMSKMNIISAYDFVNTNKLFPIHGQMRFSLVTFSKIQNKEKALFKFYLKSPEEISKKFEGVKMDYEEIKLINPNTFVCPQISSQFVFDLLKKLYLKKLVIKSIIENNSFGVGFWGEMFNMTRAQKYLHNAIDISDKKHTPLYEAKYFHHFDHRFATFEGKSSEDCMKGNTDYLSNEEKSSLKLPYFRYFVNSSEVISKCIKYELEKKWLLCVRSITSATNERTVISSIIPKIGVGNSANIALINDPLKAVHLLATFNSFLTDFIAQTKVGNQNFNIYIIEQLPILPFDATILSSTIIEKVIELVYTSWDIKAFADDVWKEADNDLKAAIKTQWEENKTDTGGHEWNPPEWCEIDPEGCPLPPFRWDEDRRAVLKAELDAIYAKLYGLTTEELRYILDPQDVYGPDFPGETFRVLKEKEIKKYGEYRTRRLVLEAWEKLEKEQKGTKFGISGEISSKIKESTINTPAMKEFGLNEGIYSVQDVSKITHLSTDKIRRWFKELSDKNYEGLATDQKKDVEKMRISFHGLLELVVIGTLRDNGFPLLKVLKSRDDLQAKSKKIYPFATNNVQLNLKVIPGKGIYFSFPEGLVKLDGTGQYNLNFIYEFFANIEFDVDGIALRMFPLNNSKLVVIDPKIGGGKPTITGKGIYVEMIHRAHQGNNSVESIMDQFDLNAEEIKAALEYSLV